LCLVTSASAARREVWTALGTETVFLWGAQLEARSQATAYIATTTQPITNYIPVLQTVANNVARFDHNPVTGESLGLLVEEQRTNLLERSEEFDNAYWTKTASSITANTIVAPDGTLTSDALVENTATAAHQLSRSVSFVSGTTYTVSVYAKPNGRNIRLSFGSSAFTVGQIVNFNLSAGTGAVVSGTPTFSITLVGNGWYRCTLTATATVTTTTSVAFVALSGTSATYTGDGYSGIYVWGAQLEAGAFPTSYIPTVASQVTRSADAASMTGANFSSWYRADEGTLYTEANKLFAASGYVYSITDGTLTNEIRQTWGGNNNRFLEITTNSVSQSSLSFSSAYINGVFVKTAHAYKFNDIAASVDSATVATDTSAIIPAVNQMQVGARVTNITSNNSTIKKLAFYPKRLTNAQLQSLTG